MEIKLHANATTTPRTQLNIFRNRRKATGNWRRNWGFPYYGSPLAQPQPGFPITTPRRI